MPQGQWRPGAPVHYLERKPAAPGGHPPFLLIHGAAASASSWTRVMTRLARTTHVVALDLPGHGETPPLPPPAGEAPTLDHHLEVVRGLLRHLGWHRYFVGGHSMGGLLALKLALETPDGLQGLLLCTTAGRLQLRPPMLDVIKHDYGRFTRYMADHGFSPSAPPSLRDSFSAVGIATPQEVTLSDFLACAPVDLTPHLGRIQVPLLWLDAQDDAIIAATPGRPGEIQTIPAAGHLLPIENPEAVVAGAHRLMTLSAPAPQPS